MRYNGQLVVCSHCGQTTFIKCIGEGERDGGFTRWNKFEDLPNGWLDCVLGELCPDCVPVFNDLEQNCRIANKQKDDYFCVK